MTKECMQAYRVVASQKVLGGIEVTVCGPGIPEGGVIYWFDEVAEAGEFIDNLNVSYGVARQFAKQRKASLQKSLAAAAAAGPAWASAGTRHS